MTPVDLRQERQRRGLSLDEVSRHSRIPRRYLDALETGHTDDLPPGPFIRAYQRQYLAFLGLPPQAPVRRHPRPVAPSVAATGQTDTTRTDTTRTDSARSKTARSDTARSDTARSNTARSNTARSNTARSNTARSPAEPPLPDEPTLEHDVTERSRTITRQVDGVPVIRLVLAGFLVTLALVLAMKLLSGLIDRAAEASAAPTAVPQVDRAPDRQAPAASPPPLPPTGEAPAAAVVPGMRVHLQAHERVRVQVALDGEPAFDGWLGPGDAHDFLGADEIAIDVSDLTRLSISYDGQRVEPLGNLSHPRRLVFVRDR
ncbi:MAG: helix-turn-helix domain-containing protein [Deltaproteobacteria bacterium]|nr:MAG: helix-turn-helix domain-containing protein [Deltaproteobacteria bacterium]